MKWLPDRTLDHLRVVLESPDLSGTKYRVIREIGRGGMGVVYEAEDVELDRRVALKVLNGADFSGEARILARLEHPGIVPVHDAGMLPDGRVFYAMKLVEGTRLDRLAASGASLASRLRMFQKACETVAFAHSHGVIHRDLKPQNILVGSFGEVLIMDWGVARRGPQPDAAPGTVMGTAGYMAPEQARGEVDRIDERSDVYALGAILRFLSGEKDVPKRLAAIAAKAMAAEPDARCPSARDLGADVARFLDALPVTAYREGIFERLARVVSRNRMAVVLVAAYLLMRVLLLLFRRP